jgi:hypothetical protein
MSRSPYLVRSERYRETAFRSLRSRESIHDLLKRLQIRALEEAHAFFCRLLRLYPPAITTPSIPLSLLVFLFPVLWNECC